MENISIDTIHEIFATCSIGLVIINDQHKVVDVNIHGANLLGYTPDEMRDTDLGAYVVGNPNHDIKALEFVNHVPAADGVLRSITHDAAQGLTKNGDAIDLRIQIHRLEGGLAYAVFRDPVDYAVGDSLTNAFTREQFFSVMRKVTDDYSLMFIDLDKFKDVNDTLGHIAGDQVLKTAASRIQNVLRGTDIFCRYGGDEFIIVIPGHKSGADIVKKKVEALVAEPIRMRDGGTVRISCSIGMARSSEAKKIDDIIHIADTRMYKEKK